MSWQAGFTMSPGPVAAKMFSREAGLPRITFSCATRLTIVLIMLGMPLLLHAAERTPQWFSLEIKFGEFVPMDNTTQASLSKCCNERYEIEFGVLYQSRYGFELGTGFLSEQRVASGATTGAASQDSFRFTLVPIQNNFTYRADFKENQLLVPYVKFGPDYVYFRENLQGTVVQGMKYGLHGTLGLQILLEFLGEAEDMASYGVNDVYFTLEGEYAWIESFGAAGLDLSGWLVSAGLLFEF